MPLSPNTILDLFPGVSGQGPAAQLLWVSVIGIVCGHATRDTLDEAQNKKVRTPARTHERFTDGLNRVRCGDPVCSPFGRERLLRIIPRTVRQCMEG